MSLLAFLHPKLPNNVSISLLYLQMFLSLVNSLGFKSSWRAVLTSGNRFDAPRATGTFDYSTVQGLCGWTPKTNRTS